ncbi:DUF523 and DUF1722 domain-containing protein [Alkalihalobacillus sp. MEB130]|uniref:YbgA family protein n=1 Tax=Alkalihalobacillus sp. MEB130 TaxID=2976704 RepID=UPI0028E087B8|nr:DUF523 and DUF1722 domain-containing protein [Alkalihalobacillus sp. MEB130]MDT8859920.1 DUF523 and DUF1722 domain-containing protein [Alkalihalobacillus sp. MEB130]
MRTFAKPKVVVSKCMEFAACRYNGDKINDPTVARLADYVEFIPVCPEVEIGLGTPREVIRLVSDGDESKLVQPKTRADLTEQMNEFAHEFLGGLEEVDGFLLKNRSPTCGVSDAKVYSGLEKSPVVRTESGLFANRIQQLFPLMPLEDEGRLRNFLLREHFFTHLFTISDFRKVKNQESITELMLFHAKNKYLFMAYHQENVKRLGRIVANHAHLAIEKVIQQYENALHDLFHTPAKVTSHINVCQHVFGYFSDQLSKAEKQHFDEMLEQYRNQKIPLSSVLAILHSWCHRFENEYLLKQTYFEPYPVGLIAISDSGKGRALS